MASLGKAWPGKLGLLFCAGTLTLTLIAQKVVSARAGLITYLQGPAFVDGKRVILKTARFPQMRDGESLSTGRGRAELLLAPGVVLRLAENSQVRMESTQLSDTRVALQRGDILIEIVQIAEGNLIHVDTWYTSTELTRAGLYRFGKAQNGTAQNTLRVYGGEAIVRSGPEMALVKRGMAVDLDRGLGNNLQSGLNPDLTVRKFDRKQKDLLHTWAARRSFELFMGDPEARQKQTHWQTFGAGYMENKNFGVEFRVYLRRLATTPRTRPPVPPAEIGSEATPDRGR